MKIKKSIVEQIIREEAVKVKKLMVLQEEKKAILKQLNELYEGDEMDENKFTDFFTKTSEEYAMNLIKKHPSKGKTYASFEGDPEKQAKYVNAVRKWPTANLAWSEEKQDFVRTSTPTDASGILGPMGKE